MFKGLFFNSDNQTGKTVEEVYLSTPKSELVKHEATFDTVVESIRWR